MLVMVFALTLSLFGLFMGVLIQVFKLQAFIVTLGGMFLARGLCYVISIDSISITAESFTFLSEYRIPLGEETFVSTSGVVALAVTGEYLSVPASVGFIALMGIAVLNGLVLVMYFNQLAARGLPIQEVVRQGALRRLRPVLMTASITALGLIPLLLATGPGSEIQRPLAIVVVGGLVSSTLLTLVLLPILYRRFFDPARGANR